MSLTTEISTMLSTISNVFIGSMPTTPDNSVCIYNTGGFPRGLTESKLECPTFQIRVRNTSYPTGAAQCDTIKDLLHGKSTTKILAIFQMGDVLDVGRDSNNRPEFTINFQVYYKR